MEKYITKFKQTHKTSTTGGSSLLERLKLREQKGEFKILSKPPAMNKISEPIFHQNPTQPPIFQQKPLPKPVISSRKANKKRMMVISSDSESDCSANFSNGKKENHVPNQPMTSSKKRKFQSDSDLNLNFGQEIRVKPKVKKLDT